MYYVFSKRLNVKHMDKNQINNRNFKTYLLLIYSRYFYQQFLSTLEIFLKLNLQQLTSEVNEENPQAATPRSIFKNNYLTAWQ